MKILDIANHHCRNSKSGPHGNDLHKRYSQAADNISYISYIWYITIYNQAPDNMPLQSTKVWHPSPGNFVPFWMVKYQNQYQKNVFPKRVPEPVPENFFGKSIGTGTGKFSSRKIELVSVPENSREFGTVTREFPVIFHFLGGTGIGTGKNWSRKKVSVPVPEKILATVALWYRWTA